MRQKHPFQKQQDQGMTVVEYKNINQPGTYLTSRLELKTIPDFGLRPGHSPVIGHASKEKLWALKLTDRVMNIRSEKDMTEARQMAITAGITQVNF